MSIKRTGSFRWRVPVTKYIGQRLRFWHRVICIIVRLDGLLRERPLTKLLKVAFQQAIGLLRARECRGHLGELELQC